MPSSRTLGYTPSVKRRFCCFKQQQIFQSDGRPRGKEKELLKQIELYPEVIQNAASNHSPALVANYTYELVKEYNSF